MRPRRHTSSSQEPAHPQQEHSARPLSQPKPRIDFHEQCEYVFELGHASQPAKTNIVSVHEKKSSKNMNFKKKVSVIDRTQQPEAPGDDDNQGDPE